MAKPQRRRTTAIERTVEAIKNRKPQIKQDQEYDGSETYISTGSTLLDLAISGGRTKYGGIPSGIMFEIFGPSGCGKTVLLCEIAGEIQRQGGETKFNDPEARLNKQFTKLFGLNTDKIDYKQPDTVPEVFAPIRKWDPKPKEKIHGVFADSLAALSTDMEMTEEEGDKMGMRRAKEFSQELRRTCRVIKDKNYILGCSNQVRINMDGGLFSPKYRSPGGEAVGFYSSLRLRCSVPKKIKEEKTINKKKYKRVIGVETEIEVFKSSVWKPFHTATVRIIFDYGIDDISTNIRFLRRFGNVNKYELNGEFLGQSLFEAVRKIEKENREFELKDAVVDLWNTIENKFKVRRKAKHR